MHIIEGYGDIKIEPCVSGKHEDLYVVVGAESIPFLSFSDGDGALLIKNSDCIYLIPAAQVVRVERVGLNLFRVGIVASSDSSMNVMYAFIGETAREQARARYEELASMKFDSPLTIPDDFGEFTLEGNHINCPMQVFDLG